RGRTPSISRCSFIARTRERCIPWTRVALRWRAILARPMAPSCVPELDEELRLRLGRRFGSAIDAWFDALPGVLGDLADRWVLEWGTLIQRGSMSVVIRCRTADGRPAVLKASPDRERIAQEAA